MDIILQHKIIMSVVFALFLAGIIIQLLLSHFFSVLITETDNMATTEVPLRQSLRCRPTVSTWIVSGMLSTPFAV